MSNNIAMADAFFKIFNMRRVSMDFSKLEKQIICDRFMYIQDNRLCAVFEEESQRWYAGEVLDNGGSYDTWDGENFITPESAIIMARHIWSDDTDKLEDEPMDFESEFCEKWFKDNTSKE